MSGIKVSCLFMDFQSYQKFEAQCQSTTFEAVKPLMMTIAQIQYRE